VSGPERVLAMGLSSVEYAVEGQLETQGYAHSRPDRAH
jgi:hypothetical protein